MEIILINIVLSFTNSLSRTSLYFSLKTRYIFSNLFSLAKTLQYVVTFKQAKAYAQDQDCGKVGNEREKSTAAIRPIQEGNV